MRHTAFADGADGTKIWYGTTGDPEDVALILCDGFACDGFIWPYFIDHFHERNHLVRWHYRGHGLSEDPADIERVGIEDLCDDLLQILDDLEIEKAVLLGHSMGAQVILEFWNRNRDRVSGLIPMCGTYKRPLDTLHNNDRAATVLPYLDRAIQAIPDHLQMLWKTMTPSRLAQLASRVEINANLARQTDFIPYLEHVAEMDLKVFIAMLKELAEHSSEEYLGEIDVPTLIIAGELDTFTPTYRSHEMHEMIPGSELLVAPNGTHIAPLELPDLINARIEKFLASLHAV